MQELMCKSWLDKIHPIFPLLLALTYPLSSEVLQSKYLYKAEGM